MPNRRPPRLHTGSLTPAPHPGARAANDPTTSDSSSARDMARGGVGDERTPASRVVRPTLRQAVKELERLEALYREQIDAAHTTYEAVTRQAALVATLAHGDRTGRA